MSDRGACPTCGSPVDGWRASIIAGEDHFDGFVSWHEDDRLAGWDLEPCGHRADLVEWTKDTGHRFWNEEPATP